MIEKNLILLLSLMTLGCSGAGHFQRLQPAQEEKAAYNKRSEESDPANSNRQPSARRLVKGRLVGFATGDYVHAVIRLEDGRQESYWLSWGIDYFLALHKDKPLLLTCLTSREYIREADKRVLITKIVSAQAGNQTFEQWLKAIRSSMTDEEIDQKYSPLVTGMELLSSQDRGGK